MKSVERDRQRSALNQSCVSGPEGLQAVKHVGHPTSSGSCHRGSKGKTNARNINVIVCVVLEQWLLLPKIGIK
jgi:hypothetical protein